MTPQEVHQETAETAIHSRAPHRATTPITKFATDETASITVDWTVLSGVAISLALGTAGVMSDVTGMLSNNMSAELQSQDLSDGWPNYTYDHFAPAIESGALTTAQAEALHDDAFGHMNNQVLTDLRAGIEALENGTITAQELPQLIATASIAYHRNLVPDAELDYYFGFDGSDPYYMNVPCNQGQGQGAGQGCIFGGGNGNGNNGNGNGNGGGLLINVDAGVGGVGAGVGVGIDANGNISADVGGNGNGNGNNANVDASITNGG